MAFLVSTAGPNAAKATHGGGGTHVNLLAIDLEPNLPAPNTCNTIAGTAGYVAGDITSVLDNTNPALQPPYAPFPLDIVVDSVPAYTGQPFTGISGIGLDFEFNPAVIQVTSWQANPPVFSILDTNVMWFAPGAPANCQGNPTPFGPSASSPLPWGTSPFRFDAGDLSGAMPSGAGNLLRINIECITQGHSKLELSDTLTGGGGIGPLGTNTMAILSADPLALPQPLFLINPYPVTNEWEGDVYCDQAAPLPTDPEAESVSIGAIGGPQAGGAGAVAFNVVVDGFVGNTVATAATTTTTDITVSLATPVDCTNPADKVQAGLVLQGIVANVAIAQQTFSVTCTGPSQHDFTATLDVVNTHAGYQDQDLNNNQATSGIAQTDVHVIADMAVAASVMPPLAGQGQFTADICLPVVPPSPACGTFPELQMGDTGVITLNKSLTNLGPDGPFDATDVATLAVYVGIPAGAVNGAPNTPWPGPAGPVAPGPQASGCNFTAVQSTGTISLGSATPTLSWNIDCPVWDSFAVFGVPVPLWACIDNTVTANDPTHVTDPTPANNTFPGSVMLGTCLGFWSTNDFTPTFTLSIDDNALPGEPLTVPAGGPWLGSGTGDDCLQNSTAWPGGVACEMYSNSVLLGGQTIAGSYSTLPKNPQFPAAPTAGVDSFTIASSIAVGNGVPVGQFGFTVGLLTPACTVNALDFAYDGSGTTGPPIALIDAALPTDTTGYDDDGDTLIDEDGPPHGGTGSGLSFDFGIQGVDDDGDGDTDEDGAYVPPGVIDEGPSGNTGLFGAADLYNPFVFPTRVFADSTVVGLVAAGAVIIARYHGIAPTGGNGTPVNILVFDAGTDYISVIVLNDPVGPPSASSFCTPFTSNVDMFGELDPDGAGPFPIMPVRQCNVNGLHFAATIYIRQDTFEQLTVPDSVSCSPSNVAVDLVKDEIIGDDLPTPPDIVDAGVPNERTITANVTGTGDLTLSITGPASCDPKWTNPLGSPSVFGNTQTDVITILGASGAVLATYSVSCLNDDSVQIIANVVAAFAELDLTDNQDENIVQVIVTLDSDLDGVNTPADNCPNDYNPDQADFDGDGIGDECDDDDDGDGVDDPLDLCPNTLPIGATVNSDGCQETDIGVSVVKDETYNINTSETTSKNVEITVSNLGPLGADVQVLITAVSILSGDCEVRLNPQAGDLYQEYVTNEPPNGDVLTSQIQMTVPVVQLTQAVIDRTYDIHCTASSEHVDAFQLQVDVYPIGMADTDLGATPDCPAPWCDPAVIGGTPTASDNVHKNYPDVTVWDNADLEKLSWIVNVPATADNGVEFNVTAQAVVINNGPDGPANYDDDATISVPGDCSVTTGNVSQNAGGSLAAGDSAAHLFTWGVTCNAPSNHLITVNNTVTLLPGGAHIQDLIANNTASGSGTVTVTLTTNADVSNVVTDSIASIDTDNGFVVTVSGDVYIGDATDAQVTISLVSPSDCDVWVTGGQSQTLTTHGSVAATWLIKCYEPSNHDFVGTITVVPTLPLHVIETVTANNTGSDTSTTAIIGYADVKVVSVTGPTPILVPGGGAQNANVQTTVTSHNNGPLVVDVDKSVQASAGAGCTYAGASQDSTIVDMAVSVDAVQGHNFIVQLNSGASNCSVTVTADLNVATAHVTDTGNGSTVVVLCRDSDSDTIANDGAPCNGPDNCPTVSNQDQADKDGDGIGDACDPDDDHDVLTKYVLLIGPAAVNLSDTNGRYMWVIAEVGNNSDHTELVTISFDIQSDWPADCGSPGRTDDQILPGQNVFFMEQDEQKFLVWRVRFECHTPQGSAQVIQTVTVSIELGDTELPDLIPHTGGDDINPSNNTKNASKTVIIQ